MKRMRFFFTLMAVLLASAVAYAQNITVEGVVTDANDVPVIGATVMVTGTQNGTSTDIDGAFKISAPANGQLTVSIIGYATQTINIEGRTFIAVQVQEQRRRWFSLG